MLVSKKELPLSNSSLAQGGVACVLDTIHDSYKLHITDTLIAGKYKNNLSAVEKLVSEGPSDVLKIKDFGVDFDVNPDGTMCKTLEAGHSRHRIVHHKDSTGKAIVDCLIEVVKNRPNVTICDNALVYSVQKVLNGFYICILKDGKSYCYGCKLLSVCNGRNRQGLQIHYQLRNCHRRRNCFCVYARRKNQPSFKDSVSPHRFCG